VEYLHETKTDLGCAPSKLLPFDLVISYNSPYSLSILRQVLAGRETRNADAVRAFVLPPASFIFSSQNPAIADLLAGLRYRVEVRRSPELGDLRW